MRNRNKHSERLADLRNDLAGFLTQCVYNRSIQIRQEIPKKDLEDAITGAVRTWIEYQKLPPPPSDPGPVSKDQLTNLANIGIGLWRLKNNIEKQSQKEASEDLRRASRHLDTIWDAYTNAGFQIIDQINKPYDPGMDLRVLTFDRVPGLKREMIVETICPTIYYKHELLQRGEIVVGTPDLPDKPLESSN